MDSRSSLPHGLLIPSQFLPFTVSQQLRHSVGRILEPVNLRAFHTINTRHWQLASMANKTLYKNILLPINQ